MHRGQYCLLAVLFVSLLFPHLLLSQAPAPAPPVAISGQIRLRTEIDDRRLSADEAVLVHLLRTRLRATARPLSWLTIVAEIQDSRYLGSGNPSNARGTTDPSADGLDMHQAWGQIDSVFNLPIDLRVGRQPLSFANERLVGVSNWSNAGRVFDGARATLHQPDLAVDLWATRLTAPSAGPTESQNFYGLWGNWQPSSDLSLDLFLLRDDNTRMIRRGEDSGAAMLQRNTFGTFFKTGFGMFGLELEGAGQVGDVASNDTVQRKSIQAFLASATLWATLDEASKTRLSLLGVVLSGDGAPGDDRNEAFNTVFGTNHKPYGTIDYVPDLSGSLGLVDMSANVASAPVKGLRMLLEGHYFLPQRIASDPFGSEVDLTVSWRSAAPFELSGGFSVFLPGESLKARIGEDPRYWGFIAGQWDF